MLSCIQIQSVLTWLAAVGLPVGVILYVLLDLFLRKHHRGGPREPSSRKPTIGEFPDLGGWE